MYRFFVIARRQVENVKIHYVIYTQMKIGPNCIVMHEIYLLNINFGKLTKIVFFFENIYYLKVIT